MEDIIRKILREIDNSNEDRIKNIEDKKKYIKKLLPSIVKFYKDSFSEDLFDIEVTTKGVHYSSENYSTDEYLLKFYFNKIPKEHEFNIRRTIIRNLDNMFNINITRYGVPLDFEIYVKTWKKL
jgi:hypothetical protein